MVEKAIQRSLDRMQVDTLDCVQFHWWDYNDKRYLEALGHLADLQQEGIIRMFSHAIIVVVLFYLYKYILLNTLCLDHNVHLCFHTFIC